MTYQVDCILLCLKSGWYKISIPHVITVVNTGNEITSLISPETRKKTALILLRDRVVKNNIRENEIDPRKYKSGIDEKDSNTSNSTGGLVRNVANNLLNFQSTFHF